MWWKSPASTADLVLLVDSLEPRNRRTISRQRDAQRRLALKNLAHLVDLPHLVHREPADRRALVALLDDDSAPRQPHQSLADMMARRAEALGEVLLAKLFAGRRRPPKMSRSIARAICSAAGSALASGPNAG